MTVFALRGVSAIARAPLFSNLSLVVGPGDRIGIVAGNGGGKSTLLRCLAGLAEPTGGDIVRARGLGVGYAPQDTPEALLELSMAEAVRRALPPADREAEGWRVDVTLDAFETPAELRERKVGELSGGWRRLALIARAWATEQEALLLDEPTNHLDLSKIELLERLVAGAGRRTAMVIASHDRQFLDACTNRTLFLRPDVSRLYSHPFGEARRLLDEDDAAQAAKREKDLREADRLRRSAAALKNIGINSGSDASQKKSAQIARRAEEIERSARAMQSDKPGEIRLANRGTHAKTLVAVANVEVMAPDGRTLFRIDRLDIRQGDRVVVLGANGVGKSQFVALLRRAIAAPDSVAGVRVNPSVVVGYVDQQMSHLPDGETPYDFITGAFRVDDQRGLSLLAGAGFSLETQRRRIAQLSPGEKARLGLLALRLTDPNFYLMDEPTNHVDIAGQERLEAEILEHEATCVLVSHDRRFVANVGARFLLVERGRLRELDAPP